VFLAKGDYFFFAGVLSWFKNHESLYLFSVNLIRYAGDPCLNNLGMLAKNLLYFSW